jgi:hypothetical protein
LEIAKTQLGLDQNELTDSIEDLARESGDRRSFRLSAWVTALAAILFVIGTAILHNRGGRMIVPIRLDM